MVDASDAVVSADPCHIPAVSLSDEDDKLSGRLSTDWWKFHWMVPGPRQSTIARVRGFGEGIR